MSISPEAMGELREKLAAFRKSELWDQIVGPRDEVLARFQPLFSPEHIPEITEAEFRSFLLGRNNKHWTGLQRLGEKMCANMPTLRKALAILIDESTDLATRFTSATDMVPGMGKNVASAILLIGSPNRYGVWNNAVKEAMKQSGLWPDFDRGLSIGQRYVRINDTILDLCRALGIDTWTIDGLWWHVRATALPQT